MILNRRAVMFGAYFVMIIISSVYRITSVVWQEKSKAERTFGIVFVTHARPNFLAQSMRSFLLQKRVEEFSHVLVTCDSLENLQAVQDVIASVELEMARHISIKLIRPPFTHDSRIIRPDKAVDRHIMFAVGQLFATGVDYGVIMEEDVISSSDFVEFLLSSANLLESDPTLVCVSGFNNQGHPRLARNKYKLLRTDLSPTLGFMLAQKDAQLILKSWPGDFHDTWDHWIRIPMDMRECLAPEIPKTKHIGVNGVHIKSNLMFDKMTISDGSWDTLAFEQAIKHVRLNDYDSRLSKLVEKATFLQYMDLVNPAFKLESGSIYMTTYEEKRKRCKEVERRIPIFGCHRMSHRGLLEVYDYDSNITFLLIDQTKGAEWIPENLRVKPSGFSTAIAESGETCFDACRRNRSDTQCKPQLAFWAQPCSNSDIFDCRGSCAPYKSSDRGSFLKTTEFITGSKYTTCMERAGFSCADKTPYNLRKLCPCTTSHW